MINSAPASNRRAWFRETREQDYRTDHAQGRRGKKTEAIESSPDVSPLRIFGLRQADEARARSPEYRYCWNSSDHWSLSQEGTQKEENRLPPAKKNRGTCCHPWSRDCFKRADPE